VLSPTERSGDDTRFGDLPLRTSRWVSVVDKHAKSMLAEPEVETDSKGLALKICAIVWWLMATTTERGREILALARQHDSFTIERVRISHSQQLCLW
jgi:hypothetical protein